MPFNNLICWEMVNIFLHKSQSVGNQKKKDFIPCLKHKQHLLHTRAPIFFVPQTALTRISMQISSGRQLETIFWLIYPPGSQPANLQHTAGARGWLLGPGSQSPFLYLKKNCNCLQLAWTWKWFCGSQSPFLYLKKNFNCLQLALTWKWHCCFAKEGVVFVFCQ